MYNVHVCCVCFTFDTVCVVCCVVCGVRRVAELDSTQAEVEQLKRSEPAGEVPFSPAGPLFSDQDM